jgi:hypothetical protein
MYLLGLWTLKTPIFLFVIFLHSELNRNLTLFHLFFQLFAPNIPHPYTISTLCIRSWTLASVFSVLLLDAQSVILSSASSASVVR